jgi:hypothetical protein
MPTVLRFDGLRVTIYPNDHRPAHVHVIGLGGEAVFILNCPGGPTSLRGSFGFDGRVVRAIATTLDAAVTMLFAEWEIYHGDQ